ncbi:MAG: DUF3857 domain-containing protein [Bacteroidetes bacterium]|nr:DUF3857 domain-containing protein [Bacteroidota bacterium]
MHLSARVYDAAGKEIRKITGNDIHDLSAVPAGTVFSDDRIKVMDFTPVSYPYTFHFKSVIRSNNTAFLPEWMPVKYYHQSLERASYSITYPAAWNLNRSMKQEAQFGVTTRSEPGLFSATVSNIPALIHEYGVPLHEHFLPSAGFSLNKFALMGLEGQADTWEQFGKWYHSNMLLGRDRLPEATKAEMRSLADKFPDPVQQARAVYQYMQRKTRYVNVAIGIGGWKPLPVADVDRRGYGDCKALSFYTIALLEAAGLPATYSIVYAGNNEMKCIDTSHVAIQGNHVIVSVPLPDTTIWLETTNAYIPFGYLGGFTDNSTVLSLAGSRAYIARTPDYPAGVSTQSSSSSISLTAGGNMGAEIFIRTAGAQFDNRFPLTWAKLQDVEDFYRKHWSQLQHISFGKIGFNQADNRPVLQEHLTLHATAYGTVTGNRMFVPLNAFNRLTDVPPRYPDRKLPFQILRGFTDADTTVIHLPPAYEVESMPSEQELKSRFGTYSFKVVQNPDQTITYIRYLQLQPGLYRPEEYAEYQQFRREIARLDQLQIVLIKPKPMRPLILSLVVLLLACDMQAQNIKFRKVSALELELK